MQLAKITMLQHSLCFIYLLIDLLNIYNKINVLLIYFMLVLMNEVLFQIMQLAMIIIPQYTVIIVLLIY